MKYTYDLKENGCLIITCDRHEKKMIRELANSTGEFDCNAESDALESLLGNSPLEWISPEETGDLTSAPMLGLRNDEGEVTARWAFMDYQVRSFLTDLVEDGRAIFVS